MTNPNDPAMPCKWTGNLDGIVELPGLTKREWFAGLALRGVIEWDATMHESRPDYAGKIENIVKASVDIADALLAELAKGKKA